MRITRIVEKTVPIRSEISNAYISFAEMTASAVAVVSDVVRDGKAVTGFGFNSNGRYAQGGILRERMIPRLLAADPSSLLDETGENIDPARCWDAMMHNEKPGGHGDRSVAVGVLDMALWDLRAKIAGLPLYQLLAGQLDRQPEETVWVYAAGGYYYPGKGLEALQDEMRGYLELGYDTVKMKIGGAPLEEDLRRIDAVLEVTGRPEALAVDANARFDLATAIRYAEALNPYGLKWYEEPLDPQDFLGHTHVRAASRTPLATGENLFSHHETRNLMLHAGLNWETDYLQMDPALSYGLVEYLRSLEVLDELGWPARRCLPHGGHQFALQLAAGLGLCGNESYPGVFQPFGGFADTTPVENGRVRLPASPGIGIEEKANLYALFRELAGA